MSLPNKKRTAEDDADYELPAQLDEISKLKALLAQKEVQVQKLQKEVKKRKSAGADEDVEDDEDALKDKAEKFKRSLRTQLSKQMVFKKSLKRGKSRLTAELPNIPEAMAKAIIGTKNVPQASNGPKQIKLAANSDMVEDIFGAYCGLSKSLRYGATLELCNGLTFTYSKDNRTLKVYGEYTMVK